MVRDGSRALCRKFPLYPEYAGPTERDAVGDVEACFAPAGALARAMPDFEPRAGQVEMAAAVARVFEDGGVLLAEAGTGTGKTLAYLVPAILSRERVLISTGTKNLQEQIYFKDIPALRDALGIPFTATYMKGRANYLCLHKLDQLTDGAGPAVARRLPADHPRVVAAAPTPAIAPELAGSAGGSRRSGTRCRRPPTPASAPSARATTTASSRGCASAPPSPTSSSSTTICSAPTRRSRQNAFGEVIPACTARSSTKRTSSRTSRRSISASASAPTGSRSSRATSNGWSPPAASRTATAQDELAKAVERLRDHAQAFFTELAFAHRGNGRAKSEERVRATAESLGQTLRCRRQPDRRPRHPRVDARAAAAQAGRSRRRTQTTTSASETADGRRDARPARRRSCATTCGFLLRGSDDSATCYFVEFRGRGMFLRASPIDVSAIVRELLLDRMHTTVLTSATLTVDGGFDYIRDAARHRRRRRDPARRPSSISGGRRSCTCRRRCRIRARTNFAVAAGREVIEILKRTRGRAFVLFTSYATMRAVQAMAEMALDYPIFAQGTAPRSQLLNQFRATPHAVLFATSSFWQGVDVVGEALSCVIVDKLPFASPGDPITAARIEPIRARGGDPFGEYQVPLAILALQQGLGRLIRHRRDRGVLAVLDPAAAHDEGTAGGSWRRCRPRRSSTISASIETFFG